MISISLSLIESTSKNRLPGYADEIFKRGRVAGSYVELSDSDFAYIKSNFSKTEPVNVAVEKVVKQEPVVVSAPEPVKAEIVEKPVVTEKPAVIGKPAPTEFGEEKQNRLIRSKIN